MISEVVGLIKVDVKLSSSSYRIDSMPYVIAAQ